MTDRQQKHLIDLTTGEKRTKVSLGEINRTLVDNSNQPLELNSSFIRQVFMFAAQKLDGKYVINTPVDWLIISVSWKDVDVLGCYLSQGHTHLYLSLTKPLPYRTSIIYTHSSSNVPLTHWSSKQNGPYTNLKMTRWARAGHMWYGYIMGTSFCGIHISTVCTCGIYCFHQHILFTGTLLSRSININLLFSTRLANWTIETLTL